MAGGVLQGKKAAITNKGLFGDDWYKKIGAIGGANGRTGGFYANRELARIAGRKGGTMSRRGSSATGEKNKVSLYQRIRAERKFEREYKKLQDIHDRAQKERQA